MQDDLKKEIRDGMQENIDKITNKLIDVYDVIVKQYASDSAKNECRRVSIRTIRRFRDARAGYDHCGKRFV